MSGKGAGFIGPVLVLCSLVGYAGYRIAQHYDFPQQGQAQSVFVSACRGGPVAHGIVAHPIVTFGDSITEGYGATRNCLPLDTRSIVPESAHVVHTGDTSYPGDLARLLHRPVLNYGVGGETTLEGLPRLQRLLHAIHPTMVVLLEGVNDLIQGQQPATVASRLLQMATLIRKSGARPFLLTVLPTDGARWRSVAGRIAILDAMLRKEAHAAPLTLIDSEAAFAAHHPLSAFFRHIDGREDGLHPNDTGYRVLAVLVYQALSHA